MPALRSILEAVARDPGKVGGAAVKRLQQLAAPWHGAHDLRLRLTSRQALFTEIYRSQAWGSRESSSGTGSELRATDNIRANLPDMLSRIGATSLLDAPCGDWNWMRHIDLPVRRYYGVDIVAPLIESDRTRFGNEHRQFTVADLTLDPLPRADAVIASLALHHVHDLQTKTELYRA
ncbi:MAG: methyltransferase domain-containing protein, partial [Sciscionella sp.]